MMVIAVDFDGTVVDHRYPEVGEDVPGAVESLRLLSRIGHDLILFTMRSGKELDDAVLWYRDRQIKLYGVNHNPDQDSWTTSPKVLADRYVDDAAVGTPLIKLASFRRPCVLWIGTPDVPGVMDLLIKRPTYRYGFDQKLIPLV